MIFNNTIEDFGPTADEVAQSHGYESYQDYCDEYMQGHTGGEMGEPSYPEIDDYETSSDDSCDVRTEDYCEGFADGYSEGYDDGYDDGWEDCSDSYDVCDW